MDLIFPAQLTLLPPTAQKSAWVNSSWSVAASLCAPSPHSASSPHFIATLDSWQSTSECSVSCTHQQQTVHRADIPDLLLSFFPTSPTPRRFWFLSIALNFRSFSLLFPTPLAWLCLLTLTFSLCKFFHSGLTRVHWKPLTPHL